MTIKEWLDGLKVGDEVVRVDHGFGGARILQTIEKISGTKRRVITLTSGERFNGATGRRQENANSRYRMGYVSPRIEEATPRFKADLERKQRCSKARLEFEEVSDAIGHDEEPAIIEAAVAALKGILRPVPPQIARDEARLGIIVILEKHKSSYKPASHIYQFIDNIIKEFQE